jgi:hypothetical protein
VCGRSDDSSWPFSCFNMLQHAGRAPAGGRFADWLRQKGREDHLAEHLHRVLHRRPRTGDRRAVVRWSGHRSTHAATASSPPPHSRVTRQR